MVHFYNMYSCIMTNFAIQRVSASYKSCIIEVLKTFRIYRPAIMGKIKKMFQELSASRIYLQKKKKKHYQR